MSDSVRPHRWQPTRLPRPWDSSGKNTGVGCHFPLQCMEVKRESEVAQSCLTLATPWTAAYQVPPSMGFSRQEYWSGVPLPSPTRFGLKSSHFHFSLSCIGEGNGNSLQYSCLKNPRDGGAWWAAIYGVTQSRTRLKWLSSNRSTVLSENSLFV